MKTENKVRMTLRLTEEENERLEQYAKANNLTKTGGIRQLLQMALFADSFSNLEGGDTALGKLITEVQASSIQKLIEATEISKNQSEHLTPEQSVELIDAMSKLRSSVDSYDYELNKIGNNINQVVRKYNASDDLNGGWLVENLKIATNNLQIVRENIRSMNKKVDALWRTVR